jgi:hypothetical protein
MRVPIYQPITLYLAARPEEQITLTFPKVEEILGRKLPPTAFNNDTWWTNNPTGHSQAKAWLAAGFEMTDLDRQMQVVTFRRVRSAPGKHLSGLSEPHRMFKTEENIEKKPFRSPLWGALKGTFTIEPGWDLTKPALDSDEMEEMDTNLDRTADMIEQGLKGGKE